MYQNPGAFVAYSILLTANFTKKLVLLPKEGIFASYFEYYHRKGGSFKTNISDRR
jgi:hypothetical protein